MYIRVEKPIKVNVIMLSILLCLSNSDLRWLSKRPEVEPKELNNAFEAMESLIDSLADSCRSTGLPS